MYMDKSGIKLPQFHCWRMDTKKIIVVIFQQYIEERYTITWRLWIIFKSKKFVPMKVILWNNNLKGKKIILLRRTFFFMHFKWLLAFTIIKYIFISTYHILHAFTHYNSSYRKFIAFEKCFLGFFCFLFFLFCLAAKYIYMHLTLRTL